MAREKAVVARNKVKIINGKQTQMIKLKGGFLTMLPYETLVVDPEAITADIVSKEKTGWLKLEKIVVKIEVE